MKLQELKTELDLNADEAIRRFGNVEALYVKFLKKFAEDTTMQSLKEAGQENDMDKIEKAAHTLKGVSANLGIEEIRVKSDKIVQDIRSGRRDTIAEQIQDLEQAWSRTVEAVKQLE